jgi:hypothetical protein
VLSSHVVRCSSEQDTLNVTWSTFADNGGHGMMVGEGWGDTTVKAHDCLFARNGGNGVFSGLAGWPSRYTGVHLTRCVMTENGAWGFSSWHTSVEIVDSTLSDNRGGGLYTTSAGQCMRDSPVWLADLCHRFDTHEGHCRCAGSVSISNNLFSGNRGNPAVWSELPAAVLDNVITGNEGPTIVRLSFFFYTDPVTQFTRNVVAYNRVTDCAGAAVTLSGLASGSARSNVFNNVFARHEVSTTGAAGRTVDVTDCFFGAAADTVAGAENRLKDFRDDASKGA